MSNTTASQRVAAKAAQLADLAGVTQAALGRALHMTQATISRKLAGKIPFSLDEIDAVADALQVDPEALITRKEA